MILKSFFRKKSTKIYFVIIVLLFTILNILVIIKNSYIKKENYYHRQSYIIVDNKYKLNLTKIPNVQSITKVKSAKLNELDLNVVLFPNLNLAENEIIISNEYKDIFFTKSIITINYEGKETKFKVKEYSSDIARDCILINPSVINELDKIKYDNLYVLNLNNWLKFENTQKEISKLNLDMIYSQCKLGERDYRGFYSIICVFLVLFIIAFAIIGLGTIINIIKDEKNNMRLFRVLGYTKFKIYTTMILIIFTLVFSSMLISVFIVGIIAIIYNLVS